MQSVTYIESVRGAGEDRAAVIAVADGLIVVVADGGLTVLAQSARLPTDTLRDDIGAVVVR